MQKHKKSNVNFVGKDLPLVIDLDGTLIRTDLLWESVVIYLFKNPLRIFKFFYWLLKGRYELKRFLAQNTDIKFETLPYEYHIINIIKKERDNGRKIILATGTHIINANKIQQYLQLFDLVLASDSKINLTSNVKRNALINLFGYKKFDYVGNSKDDLVVWEASRYAYLVNSSKSTYESAIRNNNIKSIIPRNDKKIKNFFDLLRLHQWSKNLLVFIPLFASHNFNNINLISDAFLAFFVFSLCASSSYILNDLSDINHDRIHSSKKYRPFANGSIPIYIGLILSPLLLILSFSISVIFLPSKFFLIILFYFTASILYSFYFKKVLIFDVIILALLYTLRIIAGGFAINITPSYWLLLFSMFIFFSLAILKRHVELSKYSNNYENSNILGRGYIFSDLNIITILGVSSACISVLVLALYINDPNIYILYANPYYIWLICPILLGWISRIWILSGRGNICDDPVLFALRDPISHLMIILSLVILWIAI
jgi:4-hydroxybenzoate polyprenyltransferase